MGLRAALQGRRAYFDSNIFIYLLEGFDAYRSDLQDIRESIRHGECSIMTCELTLLEILVPPFRHSRPDMVALYRKFLEESGVFHLHPITRDTLVRASLYRAQMGLKTPDALHVASAAEHQCEVFLSNDRAVKLPKGIMRLTLGGRATE